MKVRLRKYQGGGWAALGKQALNDGSQLLGQLGANLKQKQEIKAQEEEAANRHQFEEAATDFTANRAAALQVAQQYDKSGSSAIGAAQLALQNTPTWNKAKKTVKNKVPAISFTPTTTGIEVPNKPEPLTMNLPKDAQNSPATINDATAKAVQAMQQIKSQPLDNNQQVALAQKGANTLKWVGIAEQAAKDIGNLALSNMQSKLEERQDNINDLNSDSDALEQKRLAMIGKSSPTNSRAAAPTQQASQGSSASQSSTINLGNLVQDISGLLKKKKKITNSTGASTDASANPVIPDPANTTGKVAAPTDSEIASQVVAPTDLEGTPMELPNEEPMKFGFVTANRRGGLIAKFQIQDFYKK